MPFATGFIRNVVVTVMVLTLLGTMNSLAQEVPCGVASWPEAGRGNHRALVKVEQSADAVRVHIPWRRRDQKPETKDIRVFDAATGQQVKNVVRVNVTREFGDLVFQPATIPGEYEVYYLPYNPGKGNFDDAGTYFAPENTAEPAWLERNGLKPENPASGDWRSLPEAKTVAIQARSEFHRMDPMEVIATGEETVQLLAAHPDDACLLFPEDRQFAIRMFEDIPFRWTQTGPGDEFKGSAQPGEYYPFQIGVWAARVDIASLMLDFGDFKNELGMVIPSSEITCFNLSGIDWLGRPMTRVFAVGKGMVRPLWIGVQIPKDAQGTYLGTVTVKPEGVEPQTIQVSIAVSGAVLDDAGVGDLARYSRLKWLNSTLGLGEEVLPPFTPLEADGNVVRCLDREVRFGALGFPDSVLSRGREILSGPIAFVVETPDGPVGFVPGKADMPKMTPATVERETKSAAGSLSLEVSSRMEFDGCLMYSAKLTAGEDTVLKDVRLDVPLRAEVAAYMMGLGKRGGFREKELRWKWNIEKADNQIWLGDADGGLQVHLRGPKDTWDCVTLRDSGLPASWHNEGKGGCTVSEENETVRILAYSGERVIKKGEELEFRFRFLITPFKPIDRNHWNWRYGDTNADANILHIHHATPENPYINYPFLEVDRLTETIRRTKSVVKQTDFGQLTYPAKDNLRLDRGALHAWVRVNFDPTAGEGRQAKYNQNFFSLDFPNEDSLALYWNVDVRGMRGYVRKGAPANNNYPSMVDASTPEWKHGERHLLTLSWGDQLTVFVDGRMMGAGPYQGLAENSLEKALIKFCGGGFGLEAIKISDAPFAEGSTVTPAADEHTLLLDTFASMEGNTRPGGGAFAGTIQSVSENGLRELRFGSKPYEGPTNGVNLYYTVRELSNHVVEMWPLRSLGDEVFTSTQTLVYSVDKTFFGSAGGGYPWLMEHLVAGYVPSWRQPLWDGEMDAAIGTQGLSRWHNYYVEGMQWLMQNTGLDGLYLDGIGYDREIMKRIWRVMARNNPGYRINFHSGNNYAFMDWRVSPANSYMEHFPYISNLWFGEMYDYDLPPDYWFVEISGIPFGLTSEMLNYENGGNAYRGMVYGMTGRQHPSASAMWRFWDEFGIQDAEMIGYWDKGCPVRTDRKEVLATVYRKEGKSLIALAHWPQEAQAAEQVCPVHLQIDWGALGLDQARCRLRAPAIDNFQTAADFAPDAAIPVEKNKGFLLAVEQQ